MLKRLSMHVYAFNTVFIEIEPNILSLSTFMVLEEHLWGFSWIVEKQKIHPTDLNVCF